MLIYFMLRIALLFGDKLSALTKYLLAVISLFASMGWFIYTLVNEISLHNWLAIKASSLLARPLLVGLPVVIHQFNNESIRYFYSIEKYLPYITVLYFSGLLFNTVKLIIARKRIKTIKQTMSIDVALQHHVSKFARAMEIGKEVKIGLSKLVDVPCMVEYFKPVILLPFTLSTYLGTEEIEAILLHELAHIKRHDYLVNLAQQVITILLFFNPCTLSINRIINEERENCCDDLVVKATATPLIYAKALLKLEQTRQNDQQLALAATGKKYYLLKRIKRIMKIKQNTTGMRPALLAILIFTAITGCIVLLKPQVAEGKFSFNALKPAISSLLGDTTHKKPLHTAQAPVKKTLHHKSRIADEDMQFSDKKLEELQADMQKQSEILSKYYSSEAFKATQHEMEKKGEEMQAFYNNPELKRLTEELGKAGADLSKNWGDNDKLNNLSALMGEKGKRIGDYYSTPEFKKLNRDLKKKYGIPEDQNYNDDKDENYKKYQAELDSRIPAEVKLQQDELEKLGKQMSSRYESPEYKASTARLQALGDSVSKAYNSAAIKDQQKEMEKLARQMSNYQNNPELKKAQEMLNQYAAKLDAYLNSPAYRKFLKSKMNFNFDYNYNFNGEKPEKGEAPEKPEKPETGN